MKKMKSVLLALDNSEYSTGEMVRAFRKARSFTLDKLAEITGIPITNLSAIENNKIDLGVKRAGMLAAALGVHPQDILFPNGKWIKTEEILQIEKKAIG